MFRQWSAAQIVSSQNIPEATHASAQSTLFTANLHDMSDVIADRVGLWNMHLARVVDIFCQSAVDATVFQYSANACILDVLDHPQQFGFEEEDSELECGRIWKDGLHMTPGVHRILAQGVYQDVLIHRD